MKDKNFTINILGSCISREPFNCHILKESNILIKNYIQKNSICTLFGDSIECKMEDIIAPSNYLRRVTYYDFTKKTKDIIKSDITDYIIIDFAEMRFGVINIDVNNKHVRLTNHIIAQNSISALQKNNNMAIDYSENTFYYKLSELKNIVKTFADYITQFYPANKIIVVDAINCMQYADDNGFLQDFTNLIRLTDENNIIKETTELSLEYLKYECFYIKLPQDILSDKNHHLGLSSLHYEKDCYDYLANCIYSIIEKNYSQSKLDLLYNFFYDIVKERKRKLRILTSINKNRKRI